MIKLVQVRRNRRGSRIDLYAPLREIDRMECTGRFCLSTANAVDVPRRHFPPTSHEGASISSVRMFRAPALILLIAMTRET